MTLIGFINQEDYHLVKHGKYNQMGLLPLVQTTDKTTAVSARTGLNGDKGIRGCFISGITSLGQKIRWGWQPSTWSSYGGALMIYFENKRPEKLAPLDLFRDILRKVSAHPVKAILTVQLKNEQFPDSSAHVSLYSSRLFPVIRRL